MPDDAPLARTMALVRDLRVRCPWDARQTPESLRPYLVEEAHELDAAIASGDVTAKRDELGDLLLNVAYQIVIAEERGEFTADEVAEVLIRKMQRRHPHLFDLGPEEPWEAIKKRERGEAADGSALAGIPGTLPGLLKAHRLQQRAAAVGFDWPDTAGPAAKVREELGEVEDAIQQAAPASELAAEVGDLLFAVVNLARKAGVDAHAALDLANAKFERRFRGVERLAAARGVPMEVGRLAELDAIWDEVKRGE